MIPRRIIWHHSADASPEHQFAKIDAYHRKQRFPKSTLGYYVGYHYVIESDGSVKQARTPTEIGAHDKDENVNSIGICLAGDFTRTQPTEKQAAAAALLTAQLCSIFKIPITRIEPHRWDDDTQCPGLALADDWLVTQYLKRHKNTLHRVFWWLGHRLNVL